MHNLIKIVVAGDVDSGKSTLIGRYLYESGSLHQGAVNDIQQVCKNLNRNFEFSYLLDSFEEERKENLTIDTTQCFCRSGKNNSLVFIDVPGHRELLKNMLSGASGADAAVLTIDINKSVKEQTKRHAFILKFLGISKIITVINKMDASCFNENRFLEIREQVFKNLGTGFNACIPICANRGDNLLKRSTAMPWYKGKLLEEALNSIKIKKDTGSFRFLVQDVYQHQKAPIAAGIIISSSIKVADKVFILPEQKESRIKTIRYFNKNIRSAQAPLAIGIILKENYSLKRGQILCNHQLPLETKTIFGKIICTRDINSNASLSFLCTVQKEKAKIIRIDHIWDTLNLRSKKGPLKENDLAQVVLKTTHPVVVEKYISKNSLGRFVLVDNRKKIAAIGTIL